MYFFEVIQLYIYFYIQLAFLEDYLRDSEVNTSHHAQFGTSDRMDETKKWTVTASAYSIRF